MSLLMGQITVPGNSTVAVFSVPPGYSNGVFFQPTAGTQAIYIGSSASVSSSNGQLLSVTPISQESYVGSRPQMVWATTGNATAATFFYMVSTAN